MRAIEYLQLDLLQVVARSDEITLHSRVLDYTPGQGEEAAYEQRRFFDWGGWLATRPMDELPHWRVVMRRERDGGPDVDPRVSAMGRDLAEAIAEMRALLHERGTVSNRDFAMAARTALARACARFTAFLSARTLDATAIREPLLRQRISAVTESRV